MRTTTNKRPLTLVGAKIPSEIREAIEKQAATEERSISQTVARLLASHPAIMKAIKPAKASA